MTKRLLLLGGGHAHLETIAAISEIKGRGHHVTVVAPADHHYYSGMGPGMLGGNYTPDEIRFNVASMVARQGGEFITGLATSVDAKAKEVVLESGERIAYDVLSMNVGSSVPDCIETDPGATIFPVKPIESMQRLKEAITASCKERSLHIAIVGGGPSSAEVAGNIVQLVKAEGGIAPAITIYARSRFFHHFNETMKIRIKEILEEKGVLIVERDGVKKVEKNAVVLESGNRFQADIVVSAMGVRPSAVIEDSGLPMGPDFGLRVNRYLQCDEHPEIFGGGDCIYFNKRPLGKVGVFAVRQNKPLLYNLMASLEGTPLDAFSPGGGYLLVFNLGGSIGYFQKNGFVFDGKLAFKIKDYIDRRFMKRYKKLQ